MIGKINPKATQGLYQRITSFISGIGINIAISGSGIKITNTGVTSVVGTANQVNVSGSTGAVTFSLPQSIDVTSSPTFNGLTLGQGGTGATSNFLVINSGSGAGFHGPGVGGETNSSLVWQFGSESAFLGGTITDFAMFNQLSGGGFSFYNSAVVKVAYIGSNGIMTIGYGGTTTYTAALVVNGGSGAGFGGSAIAGQVNSVGAWQIGSQSAAFSGTTGNIMFFNQVASGGWNFYNSSAVSVATITSSGKLAVASSIGTGGFTVASLPVSPAVGDRAYVTDALANTYGSAPTGGHATFAPVIYTGSGWIMG